MAESSENTVRLLDLLNLGDDKARGRLIARANDRLRRLTSRMLKGYPVVGRWEQTGDVLQEALLRLYDALTTVRPECVRHFYNLATKHIRWELIDLARHYQGPQGMGTKHDTNRSSRGAGDAGGPICNAPDGGDEPQTLLEWAEFHERVEALPDEEREVFGLIWYEGLTHDEAAVVLGVSSKTVDRRWISARLLLAESMAGDVSL